MSRWEVQVLRKKRDKRHNWGDMNMPEPEGESIWVRLLVHTADIEALEEYSPQKTLLKCNWMLESVLIFGTYDELLIQLNDI